MISLKKILNKILVDLKNTFKKSDTIPIANGGTGANTQAGARKNLGIVFDSGYVASASIAAGAYRDISITFNKTFSDVPIIELLFHSTSTAGNVGRTTYAYVTGSATKTGFKARIFNGDSSTRAPSLEWHAWAPEIKE